jgi:2-amino-4-hydroxy-6-hydroxymethyldihydropteridine diphosphokinase
MAPYPEGTPSEAQDAQLRVWTGHSVDRLLVLLIGGNLGDRLDLIHRTRRLCGLLMGSLLQASRIYETAAWGTTDQPAFLNQVLVLDSPYSTRSLLDQAHRLEGRMGRRHRRHWGEREQDIDILFHGKRVINSTDLRVPHPRMAERRFVLAPLAELLPDWVHPVEGLPIRAMLEACSDPLPAQAIPAVPGNPDLLGPL